MSDSREVVNRSILEACLAERVEFYWQSNWTLLIDVEGIDRVLGRLAHQVRILGFDTFTLEGKTVYPRLDYLTDFGDGIATGSAAVAIADWPRDTGLWVEVVAEMAHHGSA
ncbi:MAG: hypothetical protein GY701_07455 [Sulfitobacter sp.]|nr:hypothetical protein [Sulfitobacter sp.]MCP4086670.1 hypothetical protein [Actinomycetes bacterium]